MSFILPSGPQVAKMDAAAELVLQDLRSLQATLAVQGGGWNAAGNVLGSLLGGGSADAVDAARNAYDMWNAQYIRWSGPTRDSVMAGDLSLESWFSTGQALHQAIASTGTDVQQWSFGGVLSQTYTSTKDEVVDDAEKAAAIGAGIGLPLLIGVGGLYLFILFGRRG